MKGRGIVVEINHTEDVDTPEKMSRRGFLEWMLGFLGTVSVIAVAGTMLEFLMPGGKEDKGKSAAAVASVKDITVGDGKVVPFNNTPAIVIHTDKGFVAFTAVCTHAGCVVTWQKDKKRIFCPCHAGVFDIEGNVVSGPPPRPLKKYRVVTQGDKIMLSES